MKLSDIKSDMLDSEAQILRFEQEGKLLGSCNTVVDLSHMIGKSIYEEFNFLGGLERWLPLMLKEGEDFRIDRVNLSFKEQVLIIDCVFRKVEQDIVWLILDRTKNYTWLQEEQQEKVESIFLAEDRRLESIEVNRMLEEIARKNTELDRFTYIVTHDLKAPFRAIKGVAGFIADDIEAGLTEEIPEHVRLLRSRVERVEDLINGILKYVKMDKGKEVKELIDVEEILDEVIITIDPPENIEVGKVGKFPQLLMNATRLYQVFQNLIGNAIKYHDKEQGKVTITSTDKGDFWEISVIDDGPGIEPEYQDRIFEMFNTLQPRDQAGGTGIGLTIVKKIIEKEGGMIKVESDGKVGTSMIMSFPK